MDSTSKAIRWGPRNALPMSIVVADSDVASPASESVVQIPHSITPSRSDAAARFLAPFVVLNGERLEREAFLDAYEPGKADPHLEVVACTVQAPHWDVSMAGRTWCFDHEAERNIWLLHRVGPSPCACTDPSK